MSETKDTRSLAERLADYKPNGKGWFHANSIAEMQYFYFSRLPAIREAAHELGYAIGLHGSTRRDLDLMAMPWRDDPADKEVLAHAIAKAACGLGRDGAYQWEAKPLGRLATSIPICWTNFEPRVDGQGILDLSVMTTAPPPVAEPVAHANDSVIEMIEKCTLTSSVAEYAGLADHAAFEAGQDNAVKCILTMLRSALVSAQPAEIDRLKAENERLRSEHRTEINEMSIRFRGANVDRVAEQLGGCVFTMREKLDAAEVRVAELEATIERERPWNSAARSGSERQGPIYKAVSAALDEAHKACFNHKDRDILGMSHGPFSGVNYALGAVSALEEMVSKLSAAIPTPAPHFRPTLDNCPKCGADANDPETVGYIKNTYECYGRDPEISYEVNCFECGLSISNDFDDLLVRDWNDAAKTASLAREGNI